MQSLESTSARSTWQVRNKQQSTRQEACPARMHKKVGGELWMACTFQNVVFLQLHCRQKSRETPKSAPRVSVSDLEQLRIALRG